MWRRIPYAAAYSTILKNPCILLHTSSALAKIHEIRMPAMSPTMTEGLITKWHKGKGDAFSAGDVLFEVETDKAQVEVEAPEDGTLIQILNANETMKKIAVNSLVAYFSDGADGDNEFVDPIGATRESTKDIHASKSTKPHTSHPTQSFLPSVSRLLSLHHIVDSSIIPASGPKGHLLKGDVLGWVDAQSKTTPSPPPPSPQASTTSKSKPLSSHPSFNIMSRLTVVTFDATKPHTLDFESMRIELQNFSLRHFKSLPIITRSLAVSNIQLPQFESPDRHHQVPLSDCHQYTLATPDGESFCQVEISTFEHFDQLENEIEATAFTSSIPKYSDEALMSMHPLPIPSQLLQSVKIVTPPSLFDFLVPSPGVTRPLSSTKLDVLSTVTFDSHGSRGVTESDVNTLQDQIARTFVK